MSSPQRGGEAIQLNGGSLGELSFEWSKDRYQHRWSFPDSPATIASIESGGSELWPTSPPLQQIHRQSFADGREVVFGVGMSGRGHWSASFTLVPELKCWIVELACRSPIEPERLLSSYRLDGAWTQESSEKFCCYGGPTRVSLEAISPTAQVEQEQQEIRFWPVKIGAGIATTQWAFRLSVDS